MSPELVVLALVVAGIAVAAWVVRRREGVIREVHGRGMTAAQRSALGAPADLALLVEFTAPGCVPCGAARAVLERVAADRADVVVVMADVGQHLDIARAHHVLRAPTTLVVAADGAVHHRISGVPDAEAVAALLDGRSPAHAA